MKAWLVGIFCLLLQGCVATQSQRSIANLESNQIRLQDNFQCSLLSFLNDEWVELESRSVTRESLRGEDRLGYKGIFFDIFRTYGISLLEERTNIITVNLEVEESVTQKSYEFTQLPIRVSFQAKLLEGSDKLHKGFGLRCE